MNDKYVLVKNFAGINYRVEIFDTSEKARNAFKQYTGLEYSNDPNSKHFKEDFSETEIYAVTMPHSNAKNKPNTASIQLTLPYA